jgi:hypothetical protein
MAAFEWIFTLFCSRDPAFDPFGTEFYWDEKGVLCGKSHRNMRVRWQKLWNKWGKTFNSFSKS